MGDQSRLHRPERVYARCDDTDQPDYLHFDLDPVPNASFEKVREAALPVKLGSVEDSELREDDRLERHSRLRADSAWPNPETGVDVCERVCVRARPHSPKLLTAIYQVSKRPKGRVLVDYNQNAWGRTLASVYSVRPKEVPSVSTPVTWKEVERGIKIDDFRIDNVPARVKRLGDLWKPMLAKKGRFRLEAYL